MSTNLHFTVDSITTTTSARRSLAIVAPTSTTLTIGTITGHVTSVATDTADNAGCEVLAVGTVVLAMSNLAAVLAGLVLIVSQSTVERSQLS